MKLSDFAKFRDPNVIQQQRATLEIPAFTLAIPTWTGASLILAEYPIGNDYYFSFRVPIRQFGSHFVPAIRWTVDEVTSRYVLFEHDDAVLYFPAYDGERIGLSAVLEIWSVNSASAPTLSAARTLQISQLVWPNEANCSCCENPSQNQLLSARESSIVDVYAYCNPFCEVLVSP